jgi:hypothetical protein
MLVENLNRKEGEPGMMREEGGLCGNKQTRGGEGGGDVS